MSADNGIYVLECKTAEGVTEFRVAHAQNIEDTNYIPLGTIPARGRQFWNLAHVWDVWHRSQVFHDKNTVFSKAYEMEGELDVCEYGVCHEYMSRPFPTEQEAKEFAAQAKAAEALWQHGSLADAIVHDNEFSLSLEHQARQGTAVARLQRAARAALDLNDKELGFTYPIVTSGTPAPEKP